MMGSMCHMGGMGKKLFVEIVALLFVNAIAKNMVKCLHDKFCLLCKKDPCCK